MIQSSNHRLFGNFHVSVLVAAHTANNLDLSHERSFENEEPESG